MTARRLTTAAVAASVLMGALAACGGGDDSGGSGGDGGAAGGDGKKTGTIAFNLASRQIPYYRDLADGMRAEAKRQGWELRETFGDQRVPTQLSQLENLATTKPDGMVVGPIDQEAPIPAYQRAKAAGIPIVTVSDNIGPSGREFQLSYVGHLYEELGKAKAQWIVDHLPDGGKVAMIHAIRGGGFTEEQNTGARSVFDQHPEIELIDGPYVGDFTAEVGLSGTENVLARDDDLDAIFYDNDDIALGGVRAIQERNIKPEDVLVVGTDGGPPALEAVKKGELDVTFSLCGYAQGVQAVRTLIEYVRDGKDPGPTVETPQIVFETANVEQKLAELTKEDCR